MFERMEVSKDLVYEELQLDRQRWKVSFNELLDEEGEIQDTSTIFNETEKSIEEIYCEKELKEKLDEALERLKPSERTILELRFGLINGIEKDREEVGELFGISPERARQIEAKALRWLRHPSISRKFRDFIPDFD